MATAPPLSFERLGPAEPRSPVVLSVPHAGRDYPPSLRAALRASPAALRLLEDRHVDAVVRASAGEEIVLVQRRARAWIDLNRNEHERDPQIDEGARRQAQPLQSAKLRSGLGLVPRRVGGHGELWRWRFTADDVAARIRRDHRPYHEALAAALAATRARFGVAVLIDVHSMPPLGDGRPRLVLGDRFGRSANARFTHRLEAEASRLGWATGLNSPYAGGYVLDRHGRPRANIHAIQVEIDRASYLDETLDAPGDGLSETAAMLRVLLDAAADEAITPPALAAE